VKPPPIPAQRVREIARHAIRPDVPPRVAAELELLASWMDDVAPSADARAAGRPPLRLET
jgi:hypothetical protein